MENDSHADRKTSNFSPHALTKQRELRGWSIEELAARVGVTPRAVRYWEAGERVPGDPVFGRLIRALGCDAQTLSGRQRGTETLSDLRRDAGLTAEQVAQRLRHARATRELNISADKVRDLERGQPVRGYDAQSALPVGVLARSLARLYRVPERVVWDAWRRSRPHEDPAPLPEPRTSSVSPTLLAEWRALNDRQRLFLEIFFQQDQEAAQEQTRRRSEGGQRAPAADWRRMPLALYAPVDVVGYTRLQERLRQAGVDDPGAGSSVDALGRRGLVTAHRDRVYIAGIGDVPRTRVELTRRGRAVARAGLGVKRAPSPPQPLLSEWLWRILVRVVRARATGVDGALAGRGPHFLAVGHRVNAKTPSRGFIELRQPDGASSGPFFWFPTDSGLRHARDYLRTYRELYPRVETEGLEEL